MSQILAPTPLPDLITGPVVFAGDDTCLTLGLLTGLRAVRTGRPLLIVDGANAFDPFIVAGLARKSGLPPHALLDEIRISRVFTCHQLEALLRGRLAAAVERFRSTAVYFSGLLDPLLDEEVAPGEATRIFRLIPPLLRRLAASGALTVCACPGLSGVEGPPPQRAAGRDGLFTTLCEGAVWVFETTRGPGRSETVQIICTKPSQATWTWEPQMGLVTPRRWW